MLLLSILSCAFLDPGPPHETVVVVRGDTLFKLGKTHGVTVQELMTWNDLSSDRIEVGQELILLREPVEPKPGIEKPRRPRRRRPASAPAGDAETHGGTADLEEPSGPRAPKLAMPAAKKCLAGPDGSGLADDGSVASQGLSYNQAKRAMDAFLPKVGSCLIGLDPLPSRALEFSITVGCNGRVCGVGVTDAGDWPSTHQDCLVRAIHRAPFPAHALPDGDTFLYPLRMR